MVVNGKAIVDKLFQHTAARRRLDIEADQDGNFDLFQHTAARRRLGATKLSLTYTNDVSTHSRPKAAGSPIQENISVEIVSTHSRPKAAGA